jgi:predicted ATPase/Tfp pilus assembly protein PilF
VSGEVHVGRAIAHFEVVEALGQGGMGVVFRATDTLLERDVALKLMRAEDSADLDRRRRFLREARTAARLSHPNIATVYEVGTFDDQVFIAMELARGRTLASILSEGPLSIERALSIGVQIVRGLAAAHRERLVHRDLKPSNVMVDRGDRVKLLDFGLAKRVADVDPRSSKISTRITTAGIVIGTPGYMSPEQAIGAPIGLTSDVFGIGVLLFEMLSGARPFDDDVWRTLAINPPDPQLPNAPTATGAIVRRCLRYLPEQRYPSAIELLDALEPIVDPRPAAIAIGERPTSFAPPRPSRPTAKEMLSDVARELFGRSAELAGLEEMLEVGARLVTITGPGGVGKTHVAIALARRLADPAAGSAHVPVISLATARTPAHLAELVKNALGLIAEPSRSAIDQIGHALAGRGITTMVLDNFEQLLPAGIEVIARWLELAPSLRIVVTSRATLGLVDEQRVELAPLGDSPAIALLRARAQARRPSLAWDDEAERAARKIVAELEGNPYAIELAAARVDVLSLAQIAERLTDRFRLLADELTGRSLRETIAWSWELLSDNERAAMSALSAFRGEFDLAAAEAVLADGAWAPDMLRKLQRQSLLSTRDRAGAVRFVIEESVRQFAWDALDGEQQQAIERQFVDHIAHRARALAGALRKDAAHAPELAALRPHAIRAAQLARSWGEGASIERAMDGLAAVADAYFHEGSDDDLGEALMLAWETGREAKEVTDRTRARAAAAIAMLLHDRHPVMAVRWARSAIAVTPEAWVEARARCLCAMTALYVDGEPERAEKEATKAITRAESAGAIEELAEGLRTRALAYWRSYELDRAESDLDRALGLPIDRRRENALHSTAGLVALERGERARAKELFGLVLEYTEATGLRRWGAIAHNNLGCLHHEAGELAAARDEFVQASVLAREDGLMTHRSWILSNLAMVEQQMGNDERALKIYDVALEAVRALAEPGGLTLAGRATVLASLGRIEEAERDLAEAKAHIAQKTDRIEKHVLDLYEGHLEAAKAARRDPSSAAALVASARARIARVRTPGGPYERSILVRIGVARLEAALQRPR